MQVIFAVPFAFAFNLQEVRFFFEIETIFFLLVFQVTLHFFVFFTLRVFDFPFVRVIDFWESFGFFAFASADICFTCRYLVTYLCFLPAFGYSHLFGVWFGFGFRFGFGFAYTYLYLFMFILRHLKADAAYSLS